MSPEYMDGDVVEIDTQIGKQQVLLLRCFKDYATTLKLLDKKPQENVVEVLARQKMFLDAGRFAYVYYGNIVSIIRTLSEAEFAHVKKCVAKAIDIETAEPGGELIAHEAQTHEIDCDAIAEKLREKLCSEQSLKEDAIRAQAERDVYKQLFHDLMERGGAR